MTEFTLVRAFKCQPSLMLTLLPVEQYAYMCDLKRTLDATVWRT
jgi:hypothetical protein